ITTALGDVPIEVRVQMNTPDVTPVVVTAGAPASNEKVSVFAGISESVAEAVNVTGVPTVPVLFPIAATTGAEFTSLTVIANAAVPFIAVDPLSVAVTVN